MVNGGGPQASAHQCTWIAAGVDSTAHWEATISRRPVGSPIDLTQATVYAAVKWTGARSSPGYAPILSDNYNSPHLYLTGADSGVLFPRMRFGSLLAYAYAANLNDGNWHILAGQFDGARSTSLSMSGGGRLQRGLFVAHPDLSALPG